MRQSTDNVEAAQSDDQPTGRVIPHRDDLRLTEGNLEAHNRGMGLQPRQKAYAEAVASGLPGVQAALRAGYGPSYMGAANQASRLSKKKEIQDLVEAKIERRADKTRGLGRDIRNLEVEVGKALRNIRAEALDTPELALGAAKTYVETAIRHADLEERLGIQPDLEAETRIADRLMGRVMELALRAGSPERLERLCKIARKLR